MRLATASLGLFMLLVAANVSWPAAPQEAGPTTPSENSTQPRIKSQVALQSIERRLVPAGHPADWPREPNVRYFPMAADEFERRLLQIHDNQAETGHTSPAAFLSRAEYRAELRDDNSLRGEANWEFTLQSSKRAFARLDDCQLALDAYRWLPGPGATDQKISGEDERAIVGNNERGRLFAVVDRSGKMACSWSLSAMHDTTGVLSFSLTLPACPLNTLQLSLASALSPVVDHGIVTLQGKESEGKRNWRIELGGNNHSTLRIINTETAQHRTSTTLVRHSFAYEITPRGLEIVADIKLDVLGAPLRQFRMSADAPLTVVMARMGENELSLGKVSPSTGMTHAEGVNAPATEYLIDLPEPVQGAGRLLRIAAIAPVSWDSLWRLPVLHFPDAIWQEGTAKLIVAKPIMLDELQLKNCRQSEVEQLTGSATGESLGIQFFEEDPEILVSASHQQPMVHVNQGARIELRANEGTGLVHAEFSAVEGETFVLEADVAGQWLIDNVVSLPAGLVADWSQQPPRGRAGILSVRLRSPLTRQQNVYLVINARRRRAPSSDIFHASDLALLKFNDATTVRRLIHVQALEPFQLQLSGDDDLHRLDPAKLTPADQALLDAKGSGIVFVDDENAQLLSVTLAAKAPQFDAEIHSQVLATDNRLIESYRFTISPSGRELRRFQIRFSQPRPEPIVWSIAGDPQALLSVKRVVTGESTTAEAGETWEAVLPTPMSAPFVLVATRETTLADDTPVALASLVDAENQRGTVQVSSIARVPPEVRSRRRLNSIPIVLPSADQYPTAIAAFQYNPTEQSALSSDPPLVLTASRGSKVLPQAWIWRADLQSNYGRDGAEHALTCRIENAGLSRIRFQPSDGARLRSVSIDGRETADSSVAAQDQWRIRLPTGDRYVTLVLRWDDDNGLRHTVSKFTTPWPTPDVPVLARTWMVSSPPGTAIAESDTAGPIGSEVAWTNRLFGPLMRADDSSPNSAESAHRRTGKSLESPAEGAPGANRLTPLIQWSTTGGDLALPPPVGWTTYQMSNLGERAQISIVDQPSMYAKAWALFVITLALRWWIGRKSVAFDLLIFGLATCFALVVPASWIPLTSAIWLGVCAGDLLAWTAGTWIHRQNAEPHISTDRSSTAKLPVATLGACIILLAAWHAYVSADEPHAGISASTVENSSKSHVLIPVDENNRPTGGTDYLPDSLYEVLLRESESKNSQDPSWLLVNAYYRAAIQNTSSAGGFASSDWECTYNVESFVDRAAIRLPLGSNGASLVPDGVELDGKPQPFHWDDDQSKLEIVAGGAGKHRLTVKLHPLVDRAGCSFTVPSVAATRVELEIPRSTAIEIPSGIRVDRTPSPSPSTSSPQSDADRDQLIAELGPVGRIVVSEASAAAPVIPTAATLDVDELYWLRIWPGSVAVDARWKVNVRSGRVQQLRVAADPRWRPLPPAEGSAISQIHPASNDSDIFVIELARPIVGRATIDASFLLVGASGIGNWRQPPFSLLDANASRRRYAVTVDNSLEFQASNIGTSTIRPEQFTAIWGAGDVAPKLAWRASDQSAGVVIKTRPRDSRLKSRYQLSLIAGLKDIAIGLLAEVAVADGPVFSYSVRIPPELEIETISVRDGTAMRNARWARSRPDLVTVFLESPVVGARQILLLGRMPTPPGGRIALPEFQVEGSEAGGFTALLLRRPEVRLDVLATGGARRMSSSDAASLLNDAAERGLFGSAPLTNDRLGTALDSPSGSLSASMRVLPNQPKLAVVQVTAMNRTADVWAANVELDCQLTDGLLDSLRLDLPPNWSGPFTVSPAIPVAIDEVTGENRRQLVLRPATPWGSGKMPTRFRLRISGPVAVAAGERPTAPVVHIHGHADQTAYVLLPRQTENQQLSWDTVGLVFRPLPGDMAERFPDLNAYRTYQVTGQQARASLRSIERNSGNPQVRQEDIAYRWQPGGRSVCVATFDLVSAGVSNCILELPGDSQLVQARLDLVPAQVSTAGPNRWSVWLGDNKLPKRLEVIFITQLPAGADRGRSFEAPRLVDWPVEKTLWSIIAPAEAGTGSISNGTPISALRYARSRFEGAAAIFDPASDSSLDKASADISDWYTLWGRRFATERAALVNLKSQATVEDKALAVDADIAIIDEQHARLMRRMGISATEGDAATVGSQPPDGIDQLIFAELPPNTVNHASVRGVGGPLAIEYSQQIRSTAIGRFILAACIGLLAIGAVIVGHRKAWSIRPVAFRPELAGAAVGFIWWLWLWPSLFGLAILCASLCVMLARRQMQKRAVRQGGAKTVSASGYAAAKSSFE